MKRVFLGITIAMVVVPFGIPAFAESKGPRFALGVQLSTLGLRAIEERPLGAGGIFTCHLTDRFGFEAVVDHFPENPAGNFGETRLLFGALAGKSYDIFGIFAKARAGFIHFGGDFFTLRLSRRTHPSIDLGGVLEYYPTSRIVLRFEAGDTIIVYGSSAYMGPGGSFATLGTLHNLGAAIGIGLRF